MPIAAVPMYLQEQDPEFYLSAPPGHRFLLYFAAWGENLETGKVDWRMEDRVPKIDKTTGHQKVGKFGPEWDDLPNDQYACTIAGCKTPAFDDEKPRRTKPKTDPGLKPWQPLMSGLLERQTVLASTSPAESLFRLDALATAPFTTGLGNEHPLENGFAFLNPYGLPYLPGSGVKGVLRQAARELASGDWGDALGWSLDRRYPLMEGSGEKRRPVLDKNEQPVMLSRFDVLFGLESGDGDKDHVRGVLSFWDVIPQIAPEDPKKPDQISLAVEIMTPHQSHYYQQQASRGMGSTSPHDSGQLKLISFLTVPPRSQFVFHITCDLARLRHLAPELAERAQWKELLTAAFEHAFQWLGFGAKTSVGYGAMETEAQRRAREEERHRREAEAKEAARKAQEARQLAEAQAWSGARLKFDRRNGSLMAEKDGRSAIAIQPKGEELLNSLPTDVQQKVRSNQFVRVTAWVFEGTLVRVEI